MAKKKAKWAKTMARPKKEGYLFSWCGECLRRYSGEMKNLDGEVIQKYNCWDTCPYSKGGI